MMGVVWSLRGIISAAVVKLQGITLDWRAPAPRLFFAGGMLIDRVGFHGVAVREISLGRVAGAVLLLAGALLVRLY